MPLLKKEGQSAPGLPRSTITPKITVKRRDNGRLEYHYTHDNKPSYSSLKPLVIADNDMMHIQGFGLDGICGMMTLKTGHEVFGFAMSLETNGSALFPERHAGIQFYFLKIF